MLDRRSFLRRSSIALAGGLLVGDAALEAFERLSHSKVFALGGLPSDEFDGSLQIGRGPLNGGPWISERRWLTKAEAIERYGPPEVDGEIGRWKQANGSTIIFCESDIVLATPMLARAAEIA